MIRTADTIPKAYFAFRASFERSTVKIERRDGTLVLHQDDAED